MVLDLWSQAPRPLVEARMRGGNRHRFTIRPDCGVVMYDVHDMASTHASWKPGGSDSITGYMGLFWVYSRERARKTVMLCSRGPRQLHILKCRMQTNTQAKLLGGTDYIRGIYGIDAPRRCHLRPRGGRVKADAMHGVIPHPRPAWNEYMEMPMETNPTRTEGPPGRRFHPTTLAHLPGAPDDQGQAHVRRMAIRYAGCLVRRRGGEGGGTRREAGVVVLLAWWLLGLAMLR